MRKVSLHLDTISQDGGDASSVNNGIENETKKPGGGLFKLKRNSIKKNFQNFSLESDDAVIEPLLEKDREYDVENQGAKRLLSKTKTDSRMERGDDKDKLLVASVSEMPSMTCVPEVRENTPINNGIRSVLYKDESNTVRPMQNHMNTNVFNSQNALKRVSVPKTQILVEIETPKSSVCTPGPLIFTTAKIHTGSKSKQMEPVHVTTVPIVSTIESDVIQRNSMPADSKTKENYSVLQNKSHNNDGTTKTNNIPSELSINNKFASIKQTPLASSSTKTSTLTTSVSNVATMSNSKEEIVSNIPSYTGKLGKQELVETNIQSKDAKSVLEIYKLAAKVTTNPTEASSITNPSSTKGTETIKTDLARQILQMDLNKNIKSTEISPGTSKRNDSSANTMKISKSSVEHNISGSVSNCVNNKKLQKQNQETLQNPAGQESKEATPKNNDKDPWGTDESPKDTMISGSNSKGKTQQERDYRKTEQTKIALTSENSVVPNQMATFITKSSEQSSSNATSTLARIPSITPKPSVCSTTVSVSSGAKVVASTPKTSAPVKDKHISSHEVIPPKGKDFADSTSNAKNTTKDSSVDPTGAKCIPAAVIGYTNKAGNGKAIDKNTIDAIKVSSVESKKTSGSSVPSIVSKTSNVLAGKSSGSSQISTSQSQTSKSIVSNVKLSTSSTTTSSPSSISQTPQKSSSVTTMKSSVGKTVSAAKSGNSKPATNIANVPSKLNDKK